VYYNQFEKSFIIKYKIRFIPIYNFFIKISFMIIDLVKYPIQTGKSFRLTEKSQYTFDVDLKLNKLQIKELIQDLFNVNVIAVNTHRRPKKKKVLGASKGYRSSYKRAIITVKSGDEISLSPPDKVSLLSQ